MIASFIYEMYTQVRVYVLIVCQQSEEKMKIACLMTEIAINRCVQLYANGISA